MSTKKSNKSTSESRLVSLAAARAARAATREEEQRKTWETDEHHEQEKEELRAEIARLREAASTAPRAAAAASRRDDDYQSHAPSTGQPERKPRSGEASSAAARTKHHQARSGAHHRAAATEEAEPHAGSDADYGGEEEDEDYEKEENIEVRPRAPGRLSRAERIERVWHALSKPGAVIKLEDKASAYPTWAQDFLLALEVTVHDTDLSYLVERMEAEMAPQTKEEKRASQIVAALVIKNVPTRLASEMKAWPSERRNTAHEVWSHVRTALLGDERAFVRNLESALTELKWNRESKFEEFLAEFNNIDTQMVLLGAGRSEDSKRVCIMNAALRRRSPAGRDIHPLMSMLSMQHSASPYAVWLQEMTKLARSFAEEDDAVKSHRGGGGNKQKPGDPSQEEMSASAVGTRQRTPNTECFAFRDSAKCRFGASCRFSHGGRQPNDSDKPTRNAAGAQPRAATSAASSGSPLPGGAHRGSEQNEGKLEPCELWSLKGKCQHGTKCPFRHDDKDKGAASVGPTADLTNSGVKLDSCASSSMTPHFSLLRDANRLAQAVPLTGAFTHSKDVATHVGRGEVTLPDGSILVISELYYVPGLRETLISAGKLEQQEGWQVNGHRLQRRNEGGELTHELEYEIIHGTWRLMRTLRQPEEDNRALCAQAVSTRAASQQKDAVDPVPTDLAPQAQVNTAARTATPVSETPVSNAICGTSLHAAMGHLSERKLNAALRAAADNGSPLKGAIDASANGLACGSCKACLLTKARRSAHNKPIDWHSDAPNDAAVADVWGHVWIVDSKSVRRKVFVSVIVDVFSRCLDVRICDSKGEASWHVLAYKRNSELMTGRKLRRLHTDNGKEYAHAHAQLREMGVEVTTTPVNTSQRNPIAERQIQTIEDASRAMLAHGGMSDQYAVERHSADAINAAVYTLNRTNVANGGTITPFEKFSGRKPSLNILRPMFCDAYVMKLQSKKQSKLHARSERGMLVGYDSTRHAWVIEREDGSRTSSVDVQFKVQEFTVGREELQNRAAAFAKKHAKDLDDSNDSEEDGEEDDEFTAPRSADRYNDDSVDKATRRKLTANVKTTKTTAVVQSERRSSRTKRHAKRDGLDPADFGQFALSVDVKTPSGPRVAHWDSDQREALAALHQQNPQVLCMPREEHSLIALATTVGHQCELARDVPTPKNHREAMAGLNALRWHAMELEELSALKALETADLIPRPTDGTNVIKSKWVYKVKAIGEFVERLKARLVACGYSQRWMEDYDETFAPVVRGKTLRALMALAASDGMVLEAMDIGNAYLNAQLTGHTVLMEQPPGHAVQGKENWVWRLKKSLYGLKQAGHLWNKDLDAFILSLGFKRLVSDPCLYMKRSRTGRSIILSTYVDDIPSLHARADAAEWTEIKAKFQAKYKIKFLGETEWLLNIRITRDAASKRIYLDQEAYTRQLLRDANMEQCTPIDSPAPTDSKAMDVRGTPHSAEESARMAGVPYRAIVGGLMYLSNTTRPDIAFCVRKCAQYAQAPRAVHWEAAKSILRYLSGTAHYGLVFGQVDRSADSGVTQADDTAEVNRDISCYADADWAAKADGEDPRRSCTGNLLLIGGSVVDWTCKLQATVALSSCEAEYLSSGSAVQSMLYLDSLMREMELRGGGGGNISSGVSSGAKSPTPLKLKVLNDNQSAVAICKNDVLHSRVRHIDIKHHFIREQVQSGTVEVSWIPTLQQLADVLTKPLRGRPFTRLRDAIVVPVPVKLEVKASSLVGECRDTSE